jgi:DNA-damage-inducible protein J
MKKTDGKSHDSWFRAKVQEALNDPRPAIPHKKVEAHFAKKKSRRATQSAIIHHA